MEDNLNFGPEDDHNLDGLFRENLTDHRIEPSSGVWKGIKRKLLWKEITRFNFANISRMTWIGGASVVVLLTAVTLILLRNEPGPQVSSSFEPVSVHQAKASEPVSLPASSAQAEPVTGNTPPMASSSGTEPLPSREAPASPTSPEPAKSSPVGKMAPEKIVAEPVLATEAEPVMTMEMPLIFDFQPAPDLTRDMLADTLRLVVPGIGNMSVLREKIPSPSFFSASLAVSPEMTMYKSGTTNYEMNYWMNLGVAYHVSRFSVASGVSLGYAFDDGKYLIDYRSKDSVGYYESVTGFTVNPDNPDEIIYTIELKNVYDSIQHVTDDRTRNRYTYLQVPLLFGYRILETSRLGLTLQAGPAVSFLIGKKEAQPYIDYPNARIIRITDNTPVRNSVAWQLWVSLRLDYQITKRFSLFAEPIYKYSFRVYQPGAEGTATNTNSFGLGIGVQYNFGSRNKR